MAGGESHGIQGPERRPGSLMTKEEQSIVSLVKQERCVQGPVSHVKKFLLYSKSNGKPLKSDIAPPPHDSTIIPAATLCT